MDKSKRLAVIIIAIVVILPSVLFISFYRFESHSFEYEIRIGTDEAAEYRVIVPFPEFSDKNEYWQEYVFDRLDNTGKADVELVETEHGLGLRVIYNQSIEIKFQQKKDLPALGVTMEEPHNDTHDLDEYYYWVYGNYSQNTTSNLFAHISLKSITRDGSLFGYRSGYGLDIWMSSWKTSPSVDVGWDKYLGYRSYLG